MRTNASGRTNRVAPDGSLYAVADRGTLWGNRGQLLDAHGAVARHSRGRNWICCVLEFHGRHRTQWQPDRLTELYFLDEATALAAGHRPCGECRHHDYQRFKAAWISAHPTAGRTAAGIDRALHADRLVGRGTHRTHHAASDDLPDGVIVEHDGRFWLLHGAHAREWSFAGYGSVRARTALADVVAVCTPAATVAVLRAGYEPQLHPSALRR